jgi:hypothetical protein
MLAKGLDHTANRSLAHIPGRPAPARKSLGCGLDRGVEIAPVDVGHRRQDLSGGRIDHIQRLRHCQALAIHEVMEAGGDVGLSQRGFAPQVRTELVLVMMFMGMALKVEG